MSANIPCMNCGSVKTVSIRLTDQSVDYIVPEQNASKVDVHQSKDLVMAASANSDSATPAVVDPGAVM